MVELPVLEVESESDLEVSSSPSVVAGSVASGVVLVVTGGNEN
jgi:hypothetical protein